MPTTTTTLADPLSGAVIHQSIGTQINHPGVSIVLVVTITVCLTLVILTAMVLKHLSRD